MSNTAKVIHLQIKPTRGALMQPVSMVEAVVDQGLRDDFQFGRSKRQVLIIECETLDEFGLPIGDVRENITVEGIQLAGLPAGTRMQVGRALLEVTWIAHRVSSLRPSARDCGIRWQVVGARYSK